MQRKKELTAVPPCRILSGMGRTATGIARWRTRHGLTPGEVARALGISRQTPWEWERGKGEPRASQLRRLERRWPGLLAQIGLVASAWPVAP